MKEGEKEERYENAYFSLFFFLCFSYVVEGSVSLYACHFYLFSLIAIHMCKRNSESLRGVILASVPQSKTFLWATFLSSIQAYPWTHQVLNNLGTHILPFLLP